MRFLKLILALKGSIDKGFKMVRGNLAVLCKNPLYARRPNLVALFGGMGKNPQLCSNWA